MSDTNELTAKVSPEQSDDDSAVYDGVAVLTNGVRVLNTSPHPFAFADGTMVPPCGTTLNAIFDERPVTDAPSFDSVEFIRTEKVSTPEGRDFISAVPAGVSGRYGSTYARNCWPWDSACREAHADRPLYPRVE